MSADSFQQIIAQEPLTEYEADFEAAWQREHHTNGNGKVVPLRGDQPTLELLDLRTRTVRAVKWIEKPYLARGELHILQGHGGVGKGALCALWAAEASKRGDHVAIVSAEDDLDTQLYPRLIAAGADFNQIHVLTVKRAGIEDALIIPDDVPLLERTITGSNIRILTIDPLLTHIAGKTDSHRDHEVKRVLTPLAKLAQATGCTIVGVHHFKKDTSGGAKLAGQGSSAFYTTARITLSMARADDGVHVIEVSKSNIGPEGVGQNLRLRVATVPAVDGDHAEVPVLERDGEASQTVDEILARPKRGGKAAKAREVMLDILDAEGEQESDQLDARVAAASGLAASTVKNVRVELKNEGLVRSFPLRDEAGVVLAWRVARTNAPRNPDHNQT
jgi:hypothetical protein